MDEISISSLVSELHQPLNNTHHRNNSCSLSPNVCEEGREIETQDGGEERRAGRWRGDDKIKVTWWICQALIWDSESANQIIGSVNCVAIASRLNLFSANQRKKKGETEGAYNHINLDKVNPGRWINQLRTWISNVRVWGLTGSRNMSTMNNMNRLDQIKHKE